MNRFWRVHRRLLLLFGLLLVIGFIEMALIWRELSKDEAASSNNSSESSKIEQMASEFDKSKHSVDEASSVWAIVNKGRKLPSNYVPDNLVVPKVKLRYATANAEMHLRSDAAAALEELFASAAKENVFLRLSSGYRSYSLQSIIYAREVKTYGQAQADRQSARPGHSEHQTGLAADIAPSDGRCEIADCFADTKESKWVAANAYKFGYLIRYETGNESLTGYKFEPWHIRFVGVELATEINKTGQTLEQFFGQPSYPSYPAEIFDLK